MLDRMTRADWKRFDSYVRKTDGCWFWTGARNVYGYGAFRVRGVTYYAHRLAAARAGLPIERSECVCHSCDVRHCVRVSHFFLGSRADNLRDMGAKGRASHGDDHYFARLSSASVRTIRRERARGVWLRTLAARFGVDTTTIWHVVHRKTWRHVV